MSEIEDKELEEFTAAIQNTSGVVVEPKAAIAAVNDTEQEMDTANDSDVETCKITFRS